MSDAAHASMMSKLLDQYEQKDNLAQQLEDITKMEVRQISASSRHVLMQCKHGAGTASAPVCSIGLPQLQLSIMLGFLQVAVAAEL